MKDQFEVLAGSTARPTTIESHRYFTAVVHHNAEADGTGIFCSEVIDQFEGISTPLMVQSKKYFGIAVHHHSDFNVAGIFWMEAIAIELTSTLGPFLKTAFRREISILV